jgi:uncharacterized protein YuzE
MEKITIVYNRKVNTLDVWFGDPKDEFICEETGEEIILKKDKSGKVIGFEKLNCLPIAEAEMEMARLPVEVVMV